MMLVRGAILTVLFLLELMILASLGYWGFHLDKGWLVKIAVGVGAPLLTAVVWGTFIAPKASVPVSTAVRIPLQLLVFGAAAAALYASGQAELAVAFFAVVLVVLTLCYVLKL